MTWFNSSTNETESQKEHAVEFVAVDFDFTSGHARAWSGTGDLTLFSTTYFGVGSQGAISTPPDRAGLDSNKKTFQLSGIDPTAISEADIEACFGRSVVVYLGYMNPDTFALIDTPEIEWEGRMSNVRRVDSANPIIEINAEHRMVMLNQSNNWRYTHEHQQQFYAGDLGFDQVRAIQLKTEIWGGQRTVIGTLPGPKGTRNNVYGD